MKNIYKGKRIMVTGGSGSITGLRPGEKVHEDLITESEWTRTIETNNLYIILSPIDRASKKNSYRKIGGREPRIKKYNSKTSRLLTKGEIRKLLKRENLL